MTVHHHDKTKRWIGYFIAGIVAATLAVGIGYWQFQYALKGPFPVLPADFRVSEFEVSPNGRELLATFSSPEPVSIQQNTRLGRFEIATGRLIEEWIDGWAPARYSPCGKWLVVIEADRIRFQELESAVEAFELPNPYGRFYRFAISRDGKWLAGLTGSDDQVVLWNIRDRTPPVVVVSKNVWGIAFSGRPDELIVNLDEEGVSDPDLEKHEFWSCSTLRREFTIPVSIGLISTYGRYASTRSGDRLAISSIDNFRLWDLAQRKLLLEQHDHHLKETERNPMIIWPAAFIGNERFLIKPGTWTKHWPLLQANYPYYRWNETFRHTFDLVDARTGATVRTWPREIWCKDLQAIPDTQEFITLGHDGIFLRWRVE